MRTGEFVKLVGTTMDTVRHYEQLGLIRPERDKQHKHYSGEHVQAFQAIQDLKLIGFTLDDIGLIIKLRESFGCGSQELVDEARQQFQRQINTLRGQIAALEGRRDRLQALLDELSVVTNK
jgi:DNA-binding transcriptional MerR regulator